MILFRQEKTFWGEYPLRMVTAGERFLKAIETEKPLQIVGVTGAYAALLAQRAGFQALYLSGGGVAYEAFGLPDLGITNLHDVLEEARRITAVTDLPLLVDIDTGFGAVFSIQRTIKELSRAGVAAVQLEDQVGQKRCGHRPGKEIVSPTEMVDRIKAVCDARASSHEIVLVARTDALGIETIEQALERSHAYVEAGADILFLEAATSLEEYQRFSRVLAVPVLANMTEFGKSPLFSKEELATAGVAIILYPLSAFRAMSKAAEDVFHAIRADGHQKNVVSRMQTRNDLYEVLDYHHYEQVIDELFSKQRRIPPTSKK
jgi:methylisocitrate lyase